MKTTLLNIVAGSIMLTSIITAKEVILEKSETIKTNASAIEDPAITLIKNEILNPIILQSQKFNKFSRTDRGRNMSYDLVEVKDAATQGVRFFNIVSKQKRYVYDKETKKSSLKNVTKTVHEIKYISASNKVLVKQADDWVAKENHRYLKLLPKPVKTHKNKTIAKKTN